MTITWIILPIYFIDSGIDKSITGLVIGIVSIPWALKFLLGGVVDHFYSLGRKVFIILGGFIFVLALFLLAFINPSENLFLFALTMFTSFCGIVVLDIAVDAWAIEISTTDERGKISGAMFAGQYAGRAFGSVFLAFIAYAIGYQFVFIAAGIVIFPTIIFPFFIKETKKTVKSSNNIGKILLEEFKKRNTQLVTIFALLFQFGLGIIVIIVPWYFDDILGLNIAQIGLIISVTLVVSAIGCLVGGSLADKIGKKKVLSIFIGVSIFFITTFVFADSWILFSLLYTIYVFFQSGYVTVSVAIFMDVTNPRVGGTQYSILTSLANASLIIGNSLSGILVAIFGYSRVFLYSAVLLGPALIVLYFIRKK